MKQYKLTLSKQGFRDINETMSVLAAAARVVAASSESDFVRLKSCEWYFRLWYLITLSRDGSDFIACGVSSFAKLNEIVMKALTAAFGQSGGVLISGDGIELFGQSDTAAESTQDEAYPEPSCSEAVLDEFIDSFTNETEGCGVLSFAGGRITRCSLEDCSGEGRPAVNEIGRRYDIDCNDVIGMCLPYIGEALIFHEEYMEIIPDRWGKEAFRVPYAMIDDVAVIKKGYGKISAARLRNENLVPSGTYDSGFSDLKISMVDNTEYRITEGSLNKTPLKKFLMKMAGLCEAKNKNIA